LSTASHLFCDCIQNLLAFINSYERLRTADWTKNETSCRWGFWLTLMCDKHLGVGRRSLGIGISLVHTVCSTILVCTRTVPFVRVSYVHSCIYVPSSTVVIYP
jgi:hypothetical protein